MNIKKEFVVIFIMAIIAAIVYVAIGKLSFMGWTDGTVSKSETIKKSDLGDEFLLKYVVRDFPDVDTTITIMDSIGKEKIIYFVNDGDEYNRDEDNLLTILNSNNIRCYEIYDVLLYRVDNGKFKGVQINPIDIIDILEPNKRPEFVKVAKALVSKKEWKWIKNCGEFLIKEGDQEFKTMLQRYASGEFTEEEIKINVNSEISKEEMQDFAKQILTINY